ncbi:MAG: carbon-nitrogen hydrolase family protein [Anaerolineae bacterium]|nr:carbon-nitrogen hydrolase family protein [Thermoflexales bacterium]MDW8406570.1 carbon-nitrogen hydrolase family protein [Anaerolineae bacterium]
MREVTVAVIQMDTKLGEPEANLAKMSEFVRKVTNEQKVDLILFPELATTGYECGVKFTQLTQRVPGPAVNVMAQRANETATHIAFGIATKERVESILFNSAVLVGPEGDVVHHYRKLHLRGEEQMLFRPGFRLEPAETPAGLIGLQIGWDIAFPEGVRSLCLDGAEVILVSAAWEAARAAEWRTFISARAAENACFVCAANRIGEEPATTFCGESMIVGPRGQVIVDLDESTEGYIVAKLNLDENRRIREETQIFQTRQPLSYRSIVRKY